MLQESIVVIPRGIQIGKGGAVRSYRFVISAPHMAIVNF